ncbi:MAG: DUF3606 domain-containing protein [Patescibacteria group bacterium]
MTDDPNKKKQDAKEIALLEAYEVAYMYTQYKVPKDVTKQVVAKVGHSREKVMVALKAMGYIK